MKKKILGAALVISLLCTSLTPMFGCNKGGNNSSSSADNTTACVHEWTEKTEKEPTCAENGVKKLTCGKCQATKTEKIPATGHTFPDKGTVASDPTCIAKGSEEYVCSVCGIKESESIAPVGHNYDDGEITTEPGCFSNGVKTYTCTTCGDTYTEPVIAVGHKDADYDGNCDMCEEFIGEISIPVTEAPVLADGPWTNPKGFSWWSYDLEKTCSEEVGKVFTVSDNTYSGEGQGININFNEGSKATSAGGAYIMHIGMQDLEKNTAYTLTFYAKATNDFTGNLNKMLCNANFAKNDSITGINYTAAYGAKELAGKDWVKVMVHFTSNHDAAHGNMCAFRIAFDVGTEGWKGAVVLSDFMVSNTEYIKKRDGDQGTEIGLSDFKYKQGYYFVSGPECTPGEVISIDDTVEYNQGSKSIKFDTTKADANSEYIVVLALPGLTEGKRYTLTFYAKGSADYNSYFSLIGSNSNFQKAGVDTMLDVETDVSALTTAEGMKGQDWLKATVTFTANPTPDGFADNSNNCSFRLQLKTAAENVAGAVWLSYFVVTEVAA